MNKSEWKKLYHNYRHGNFEFTAYMARNNFPCGHDDMLYGRHEGQVLDFIEKSHPILKQVLDIIDSTDPIAYRAWLLDDDFYGNYKLTRLKEMMLDRRTA